MSNTIDYEINKELGECYLFMGEYTKARGYYLKAIDSDTSKADPHMGLAAIALTQLDLDTAFTHYTKAHELNPDDKSLVGIAMVELELGRHEDAYNHFVQVLEMSPSNMIAINGIVQLGYFLDRLEGIVPLLINALNDGAEESESVRYALAGCLMAMGKDPEAKIQLEVLLSANPENDKAQQLYARIAA